MSELNIKTLLPELQKQVARLSEDLLERCTTNAEVNSGLRAAFDQSKEGGRTADSFEVWREDYLDQVAVAWVLACVFVRFMEDNGLIDDCYLAGEGDRRKLAEDTHELYFREHPHESDREYFEHVFREVGRLPACADLFANEKTLLWAVGPTGDAAMKLLAFWREIDAESGMLRRSFKAEDGRMKNEENHPVQFSSFNPHPSLDTRFLGDLYQDLSERARKKYALLQTPVFIEEFILDRTLTPAIDTFGLEKVRMIDPTCGSGHFCLGGFERLFRLWLQRENNEIAAAQKALDGVWGVDLNPFAVAIARFRLIVAAMNACGIRRLKEAPAWRINLAVGDSLLHGRRFGEFEMQGAQQRTFDTGEEVFRDELKHHYEVEDVEALHRILGQQYHAVVGNPPYITVKDRAVSELYRARFPSCGGKYSLSVPFMERFFDLAVKGGGTTQQPAGFVGQITANSFMKREFGKKLIKEYLPRWDLTHVLDTSGAYIPGHGTPTVILFGKNQPPTCDTIRTVFGIAGEPATPAEPTLGLVWQAIVRQIDQPGSVSEWVSAGDSPRTNFKNHPWSIGGGGAAELKETIEENGDTTLEKRVASIGIGAVTLEDDAFAAPAGVHARAGISEAMLVDFAEGDIIREWAVNEPLRAIFPYKRDGLKPAADNTVLRFLWPQRSGLRNRKWFRKTQDERGFFWWEYGFVSTEKLSTPRSIAWGEVTSHNHFVLDSSGKVFKQTAPIIKLRADASTTDHIQLLGVLNSSTAGFWLRQVCFPKGGDHQGGEGARVRTTLWDERFAFNVTQIATLPIPAHLPQQLPTALVKTSTALQGQSPAATLASWSGPESGDLRPWLARARDLATHLRRQLIAWQEELDWQVYEAFGLVEPGDGVSFPEGEGVISNQCSVISEGNRPGNDHCSLITDDLPELELGQRAFEIVLARKMAAGEVQTTWFERHGSTPTTELPAHWPAAYRELVERRIARIESDPNIRLIEQPEYKRRWNTEPWDKQLERALRDALLLRLEQYFFASERMAQSQNDAAATSGDDMAKLRNSFIAGREPALVSVNQLADVVHGDPHFLELASIYRGRQDFNLATLITELVESESVPFLPVLRYKPPGLRKRELWERTWDLQRREDEIERRVRNAEHGGDEAQLKTLIREAQQQAVGDIPVPPKYASADFLKSDYWRLRGKLDVPKERWVSCPHCETDSDPSLVIAWAGWDHLQQATALVAYYDARKREGWTAERLTPLLAGLDQLLPWIHQWHPEVHPDFGETAGKSFQTMLTQDAHELGLTLHAIRAWEPPAKVKKARKKKED